MRTDMFGLTSRYQAVDTAEFRQPDGTVVVHLRRRFVPDPERFGLLQEHRVEDGERLDVIAAQHLGDPEQFWRLCDANGATRPDDLTAVPGRVLRITLPDGIPGPADA